MGILNQSVASGRMRKEIEVKANENEKRNSASKEELSGCTSTEHACPTQQSRSKKEYSLWPNREQQALKEA